MVLNRPNGESDANGSETGDNGILFEPTADDHQLVLECFRSAGLLCAWSYQHRKVKLRRADKFGLPMGRRVLHVVDSMRALGRLADAALADTENGAISMEILNELLHLDLSNRTRKGQRGNWGLPIGPQLNGMRATFTEPQRVHQLWPAIRGYAIAILILLERRHRRARLAPSDEAWRPENTWRNRDDEDIQYFAETFMFALAGHVHPLRFDDFKFKPGPDTERARVRSQFAAAEAAGLDRAAIRRLLLKTAQGYSPRIGGAKPTIDGVAKTLQFAPRNLTSSIPRVHKHRFKLASEGKGLPPPMSAEEADARRNHEVTAEGRFGATVVGRILGLKYRTQLSRAITKAGLTIALEGDREGDRRRAFTVAEIMTIAQFLSFGRGLTSSQIRDKVVRRLVAHVRRARVPHTVSASKRATDKTLNPATVKRAILVAALVANEFDEAALRGDGLSATQSASGGGN